jgi:hypothetical protein
MERHGKPPFLSWLIRFVRMARVAGMNAARLCLAVSAMAALVSFVSCSKDPAPSPNPPLVIEPNVSVGSVRAGMSMKQVIAELGEPQRRTAKALEYTRLGFAVLPNSSGVVQTIMCGDVTGVNGPLVQAFTGRTKEGIGMKSTREELLKAFGEPTQIQTFPGGMESLLYQPLGITFTLEGGKVHHIIVRLGDAPQTDRTVTIEPTPSQPK